MSLGLRLPRRRLSVFTPIAITAISADRRGLAVMTANTSRTKISELCLFKIGSSRTRHAGTPAPDQNRDLLVTV